MLEQHIYLACFLSVLCNDEEISALGWRIWTECWVKSWICEIQLPGNSACWFPWFLWVKWYVRWERTWRGRNLHLWVSMFPRAFTNIKNILKRNKETDALLCWCIWYSVFSHSLQGCSWMGRKPHISAESLEEVWLLGYLRSWGIKWTCMDFPFAFLFHISLLQRDGLCSPSIRSSCIITQRSKRICIL